MIRRKHPKTPALPLLLLAVNAVYILLYRTFLSGNAVYLYTDIGSDSITSSFPIIVYLGGHFRRSLAGFYQLESGLGADLTQIAVKYLNPLKTLLLFFSKETLPAGLMLEQLLLTNVCAAAGFFYFRHLFTVRDGEASASARPADAAACFASLMWAYSGYMTLWSQNLTVGVCVVMFTVFMAHLQHFLDEPRFGTALRMAPALSLFLITNYYYTWMTGVFTVLYLVFYAAFTGRGIRRFLRDGIVTFFAAAGGCAMAAWALLSQLGAYTGSVRAGGAEASGHVFDTFGLKGIMTTVGRLFSVNMTGSGNSYSGAVNYYEEAALSVSIIALFAVVWLILEKRTRMRALMLLVFTALVLLFKNSGAVLQLNANVQRYSFLIAFLLSSGSGFFVRELLSGKLSRRMIASVAAVSGFTLCVLIALLLFLQNAGGYSVSSRTLKMVLLFAVLFLALFGAYLFGVSGRCLVPAAFFVLCLELVVMNNDTLYHREYVTKAGYRDVCSGNGLEAAVEEIRASDDGVYRIGAARSDADMNDGLLLSFPQTAVYSNSNPASLKELEDVYGTTERSRNHFSCDDRSYGQYEALSGRYLIRDRSGLLKDSPPGALFERISETPDGTKTVYRNRYALPFGYLLKEGRDEPSFSVSPEEGDTVTDLLPSLRDPFDVTVKSGGGNTWFIREGEDPYVYMDLPAGEEGDGGLSSAGESVRILQVSFKPDTLVYLRSVQFYYLRAGQQDPHPEDYESFFLDPKNPVLTIFLPDSVSSIRFDFPSSGAGLAVESVNLIESRSFVRRLKSLAEAGGQVQDIRFEENIWSARAMADGKTVLCVPFLYSPSWKAQINGQEVPVKDSGGLCAVELAEGENEVTLTFCPPFRAASRLISAVGWGLWLLWALIPDRRRKLEGI